MKYKIKSIKYILYNIYYIMNDIQYTIYNIYNIINKQIIQYNS